MVLQVLPVVPVLPVLPVVLPGVSTGAAAVAGLEVGAKTEGRWRWVESKGVSTHTLYSRPVLDILDTLDDILDTN